MVRVIKPEKDVHKYMGKVQELTFNVEWMKDM